MKFIALALIATVSAVKIGAPNINKNNIYPDLAKHDLR